MKAILKSSLACGVVCLFLAIAWVAGLRVNTTPSLPRGLYQIAPEQPVNALTRDDLVSFCPDEELATFALERGYLREGSCPSGVQPLLKKLAGLPGDELTVDADGIHINGQLYPNSIIRQQDSDGNTLESNLASGRIPQGKALILSDQHTGSFDSRYFGLVELNQLQKVKEVFICF